MMSLTFFLPLLLSHMTDHMTGQELADEDRYNNYKAQFNSKCESLGQKADTVGTTTVSIILRYSYLQYTSGRCGNKYLDC